MIKTSENIVDPVAFIESDPMLVAQLESDKAIAVSGADLDVDVRRRHMFDTTRSGRISEQTSHLLGNLYMQHVAYGEKIADETYDFEWFPSPTAVNNLVESLGLRPGEDVMRFTHSDGAKVPVERYFQYIADNEYPQSTDASSGIFAHDRNRDHAIGVLLMPRAMKDFIVDKAEQGGVRIPYEKGKIKGLAHAYDTTTNTLGILADQSLWPRMMNQEADAVEYVAAHDTILTSIYFPQLWPTSARRANDQRREAIEMLAEHLSELYPRVVELQSKLQKATANV